MYKDLKTLLKEANDIITKHCKKVNAKKCRLIYKFNNIYWF